MLRWHQSSVWPEPGHSSVDGRSSNGSVTRVPVVNPKLALIHDDIRASQRRVSEMLLCIKAARCPALYSCDSAEMGMLGELLRKTDWCLWGSCRRWHVSVGCFSDCWRGFLHVCVSTYFIILALTKFHVLLPSQWLKYSLCVSEIYLHLFVCAHIPSLTREANARSLPNACDITTALES